MNWLPKLLVAGRARESISNLAEQFTHDDVFSSFADTLNALSARHLLCAKRALDFGGHAWVWGSPGDEPFDYIPEGLAIPWHAVSCEVGRPPVLSYDSYALQNWRRIDPEKPIALDNIAILNNFLGGMDEDLFIMVHVAIEAQAGPLPRLIREGLLARAEKNTALLGPVFIKMSDCLVKMLGTLRRMRERCDPLAYYLRARPYIHGWTDRSPLPNGLIYRGVEAYAGFPQKFRGETGAQSSIIPMFDAFLGVSHKQDLFVQYLLEMREYVPPGHRKFIEDIEARNAGRASVRSFVKHCRERSPHLIDLYNRCLELLAEFRVEHIRLAHDYIFAQAEHAHNPTKTGTGGTPFMHYLKKHIEDTKRARIRS